MLYLCHFYRQVLHLVNYPGKTNTCAIQKVWLQIYSQHLQYPKNISMQIYLLFIKRKIDIYMYIYKEMQIQMQMCLHLLNNIYLYINLYIDQCVLAYLLILLSIYQYVSFIITCISYTYLILILYVTFLFTNVFQYLPFHMYICICVEAGLTVGKPQESHRLVQYQKSTCDSILKHQEALGTIDDVMEAP